MAHSLVVLFLARWLAAAGAPPPVFVYESDSLRAAVRRFGETPAVDSAGEGWSFLCDTAAAGGAAWYEIELADTRSGGTLRFPADDASLAQSLGPACREGKSVAAARIAAGLKAMASRLRVRMRIPGGEAAP